MKTVAEWKALLRDKLRAAQLARRADDVAVFREILAAIDNAEAPPTTTPTTSDATGAFAGSVAGAGASDVDRLALSPAEVCALIRREVDDRRAAAASYESLGRTADATRLAAQADLLAGLLA
jgi:uncharacterized protein